jgi:lipoprotein-anchoring transpeptidase ErfK/SrfK
MKSKNFLSQNLLFATIFALVVGFVSTSDAATRFNGRSKSASSQSDRSSSEPRKKLFNFKKSETAPKKNTYTRTPISPGPPVTRTASTSSKPKKRGLLAALFGKKDRASSTSSRLGRSSNSSKPAAKPSTSSVKINHALLAGASRSSSRVIVDISRQKAYLLVGGKIAVTSPVSTARRGKYTPRGTFSMTQRVPQGKVSTIYHVEMPYWMRLGGSVYGMHAGYLPGYPASAGCIRLPAEGAQQIFSHTRSGTRVSVMSSWSGAGS